MEASGSVTRTGRCCHAVARWFMFHDRTVSTATSSRAIRADCTAKILPRSNRASHHNKTACQVEEPNTIAATNWRRLGN